MKHTPLPPPKMYKRSLSSLALGSLTCLASVSLYANTLTWTGNADDNQWSSAANWSPEQVPAAGDSVSISGVADPILLDAPTAELDSLALSSATLSLNHWNTRIRATTVTIGEGGIVTSEGPFDESLDGEGNLASRVWIDCTDLTIALGGAIDVTGKGYGGRTTVNHYGAEGYGPGKGKARERGASHGGSTRPAPDDNSYGSLEAPETPGSGGGLRSYNGTPGDGGGVVRIEASGTVTVNGSILADGTPPSYNESSAGAGGSIYITCASFAGNAGVLRAAGATWKYFNEVTNHGYTRINRLNGAGGRIAIVTAPNATHSASGMTYDVSCGGLPENFAQENQAGDGTLYFSDASLFLAQSGQGFSGRISIPGFDSWTLNADTTFTSSLQFLNAPFHMTVNGDLTLSGERACLSVGGPTQAITATPSFLRVTGALRVEDNAKILFFDPEPSPEPAPEAEPIPLSDCLPKLYADTISVGNGGVITAAFPCDATKDAQGNFIHACQVWLECRTLTVDETGAIDASAKGFLATGSGSCGPLGGGNNNGQGGGHGGLTNYRSKNGNKLPYGSIEAPCTPGSSGGKRDARGGHGGGIVRIIASETITVNGTIAANGERVTGQPTYFAEGQSAGAGGSVYITCDRILGSTGAIEARGGDSYMHFHFYTNSVLSVYHGLNGGGGRIAIHYNPSAQLSSDISGMRFDTSCGSIGYNTRQTYSVNVNSTDWSSTGSPIQTILETANFPISSVNEYFSRVNEALPGTLYFPDSTLFLAQNGAGFSGQIYIPGFTSWTVEGDLALTDQQLWFPIDGFQMNISGNLTLSGLASSLRFGGSSVVCVNNLLRYFSGSTPWNLTVGGNFTLGQGSTFEAFPATTDMATEASAYGAFVTVGGEFTMEPYSILTTRCEPVSGSAALYTAGSVDIQADALVTAVDFGFPHGENRNNAIYGMAYRAGAGGGYGGFGGQASSETNNGIEYCSGYPYGDPLRPWLPGSGGHMVAANDIGHRGGGGAVRFRTTGSFNLDGTINANGAPLGLVNYCTTVAAGSGGGIFLESKTFSGSGALLAEGGSCYGMYERRSFGYISAGGGGRIAVYTGIPYDPETMNESYLDVSETAPETFTGLASAAGGLYSSWRGNGTLDGSAYSGTDGTIRFIRAYVPYTVIFFR